MRQEIKSENYLDHDDNPTGGTVKASGITIHWQDGPLGRHAETCADGKPCGEGCTRKSPNGAFVEGVIEAAKQRLEFFQRSKFKCAENQMALEHLEAALASLDARTNSREKRGVEGTHKA